MTTLVEKVAKTTIVQEIPGIKKCFFLNESHEENSTSKVRTFSPLQRSFPNWKQIRYAIYRFYIPINRHCEIFPFLETFSRFKIRENLFFFHSKPFQRKEVIY
jgi:hypothetical protein